MLRSETDRDSTYSRGFWVSNYIIDGMNIPTYQGWFSGVSLHSSTATVDRVEVLRGATGVLVEQHTHDVDGLLGQRHDVGRDVLRLLPLLAHIQLELLHDVGRDDPQPTVQIELIRHRLSQLAGSHAGQQQ